MRLGAACGDELAADRDGKRQVGKSIAMHVSELAAADAEFDAAESMRRNRDAFPRADCLLNARAEGTSHLNLYVIVFVCALS